MIHTLKPMIFINPMVSHYLLPHILHPTRVTDHTATIVNNILFNTLEFDTLSGNLLTKISDHFPQFLVIKKAAVDYKNGMITQNLVNIYFWMILRNSVWRISLIIKFKH